MTAHRSTTVPTTIPTAAELADLGALVAESGPDAHHRELVRLAHIARSIVGPTAAAEVLADADAPSIARQRALAVVSAAVLRDGAARPRRESLARRVHAARSSAARPADTQAALTFALASRQLVR